MKLRLRFSTNGATTSNAAARTIIIRYPVVNPRPPKRHEFTIAIERVFAPRGYLEGRLKAAFKMHPDVFYVSLFIILVYGHVATISRLKEIFSFAILNVKDSNMMCY